ncbi:LuxR C-terminal-related transcriptional regulator [Citrobacter werkmanii]|uniref:LuxR C-terminal-related transcriptional regulator n=1 Tax=Citrobacter werkmanii TaxID=67827 RepID=UPI0026524369|nr:LuxR C-terminal-related transcriptional regulator [Citrobacter werkmanii]MDN8559328.1 LuxR C-terminal-related transcriptional regulator [Citrobacter werkmanii]
MQIDNFERDSRQGVSILNEVMVGTMSTILIYSQCYFSLLAMRDIACRMQSLSKLNANHKIECHSRYNTMQLALESKYKIPTIFFRMDKQNRDDIKRFSGHLFETMSTEDIRVYLFGEEKQCRMAANFLRWQNITSHWVDIDASVSDIEKQIRRDMRPGQRATETESSTSLSRREEDVLIRALRGESPDQISRALGLNRKTIYSHRNRALKKMGCESYQRGVLLLSEWMW